MSVVVWNNWTWADLACMLAQHLDHCREFVPDDKGDGEYSKNDVEAALSDFDMVFEGLSEMEKIHKI